MYDKDSSIEFANVGEFAHMFSSFSGFTPRGGGIAPVGGGIPRGGGIAPIGGGVPRGGGIAPVGGGVSRGGGIAPVGGGVPRGGGIAPVGGIPRGRGIAPPPPVPPSYSSRYSRHPRRPSYPYYYGGFGYPAIVSPTMLLVEEEPPVVPEINPTDASVTKVVDGGNAPAENAVKQETSKGKKALLWVVGIAVCAYGAYVIYKLKK